MQYEDGNISPLRAFFRKKWVRLVLIADILIIIAIIVALIIKASRVSTLNFNVTPLDATISVNGDTSYSNGAYSVSPGTYQITISHPDLETKTFTAEVEPHFVSIITTFLAGENNNYDFYKQKDNYLSFQKLAEIASKGSNITTDHDTSAEDFITNYYEKYDLLRTILPINYSEYEQNPDSQTGESLKQRIGIRIGKQENCETSLCIEVIMLNTKNEDLVKKLLNDKGINYKDYEIVYKTY